MFHSLVCPVNNNDLLTQEEDVCSKEGEARDLQCDSLSPQRRRDSVVICRQQEHTSRMPSTYKYTGMRGCEAMKRSKRRAMRSGDTWCANHVITQLIAKNGSMPVAMMWSASCESAALRIEYRSCRLSTTASNDCLVLSRRCPCASCTRRWYETFCPTCSKRTAAISCSPCTRDSCLVRISVQSRPFSVMQPCSAMVRWYHCAAWMRRVLPENSVKAAFSDHEKTRMMLRGQQSTETGNCRCSLALSWTHGGQTTRVHKLGEQEIDTDEMK
jgi:hypothetical protein